MAQVLAVLAVLAPLGAHAVPLDEIRQVLRAQALSAPSEADLTGLREDNLPQALARMDPYARFYAPGRYVSPAAGREARVGIGADLVPRGGELFLSVYQGGAAFRAGVPDRAKLVSVDGRQVSGLDPQAAAQLLRGGEHSPVRLGIVGPDGSRPTVAVRREVFRPLDVEAVLPGNRVVRIRDFAAGLTRPALQATLGVLDRAPGSLDAPLIIDLRDATGGDLYEAFDMAALFLPAGTLLGTLRGPDGKARHVRAQAGEKYGMPVALLVGPDTASAAEIFAGALNRNGRAKLVGRRTFGKCSTQTDVRLSDGSVLRFTNLEVLLPGGDSCSGTGLVPDREVDAVAAEDLARLVAAVRTMFNTD
ncbi:S41 family peptidase [Desulfomicrobium salsuginis]